jgi:hypothetical protein
MPKWLRITTILLAAVIGAGGAALGYSKPVTMLVVFAALFASEGVNFLIRRREGHDA